MQFMVPYVICFGLFGPLGGEPYSERRGTRVDPERGLGLGADPARVRTVRPGC